MLRTFQMTLVLVGMHRTFECFQGNLYNRLWKDYILDAAIMLYCYYVLSSQNKAYYYLVYFLSKIEYCLQSRRDIDYQDDSNSYQQFMF